MSLSCLPYDILANIASHLKPHEEVAVASTARQVYEAWMPILLESISIYGDYNATSGDYISYASALCGLFERRADFIPSVRKLTLRLDYQAGEGSDSAWQSIADLCAQLVNLQLLRLSNSNITVAPNLRVIAVIATLPKLQTIHIEMGQYISHAATQLLNTIQAPVTEVWLYKSAGGKKMKETTFANLIKRFYNSLQRLDVLEMRLDASSRLLSESFPFTHLTGLSMRRCVLLAPNCLPQLFPNLRKLLIQKLEVCQRDADNAICLRPWSLLQVLQTDLSSARNLSQELAGCVATHMIIMEDMDQTHQILQASKLANASQSQIIEVQLNVQKGISLGSPQFHPIDCPSTVLALYLSIRFDQVQLSSDVDSIVKWFDEELLVTLAHFPSVQYLNLVIRSERSTQGSQPFSVYPDYYEGRDIADVLLASMSNLSLLNITWRQAGWKSLRYRVVCEVVAGVLRGRRWVRDGTGGWTPDKLHALMKKDRHLVAQMLSTVEDHMTEEEYDELYNLD